MGVREKSVWDRWLITRAAQYERIGVNVPLWFNVPAGGISVEVAGVKSSLKSEYRIDAVAGNGTDVRLIEVKDIANLMAVGQLLTYEILFARTYQGWVTIDKLLVCRKISKALAFVCENLGISVEIV